MTTTVEPPQTTELHLSEEKLDAFSSSMTRLIMLWIVLVGVASFVTVPRLSHTQWSSLGRRPILPGWPRRPGHGQLPR